jgi:IgA-specific serine endopeptidase
VLQNLSERLEHDIAEMMISNGDAKKSRKRIRLQEPLKKARQEVLKEQLLHEEFVEEQKVRAETTRAQEQAQVLRAKRLSRHHGASIDIDERLDSQDEDYVVLQSYPGGPDEVAPDPERDPSERELREKFKSEQHVFRDEQKKLAFERELLRKQRHAFGVERDRFEERRRQHPDDGLRREHSGREREHEVRRRRSEEPRRQREEDARERKERREDLHVAQVYEEPRHRRRRGGRMSFF